MQTYHDRLLTSAVLYLKEAVTNYSISLETDPDESDELSFLRSKAIIHIHIAAEMIMKDSIMAINWEDIFSSPKKADKSKLKSGNFKSITYGDCIKYLKRHSVFSKSELNVLHRLGIQRNKAFHFAHKITTPSLKSLITGTSNILLNYFNNHEDLLAFFNEDIADITAWSNIP